MTNSHLWMRGISLESPNILQCMWTPVQLTFIKARKQAPKRKEPPHCSFPHSLWDPFRCEGDPTLGLDGESCGGGGGGDWPPRVLTVGSPLMNVSVVQPPMCAQLRGKQQARGGKCKREIVSWRDTRWMPPPPPPQTHTPFRRSLVSPVTEDKKGALLAQLVFSKPEREREQERERERGGGGGENSEWVFRCADWTEGGSGGRHMQQWSGVFGKLFGRRLGGERGRKKGGGERGGEGGGEVRRRYTNSLRTGVRKWEKVNTAVLSRTWTPAALQRGSGYLRAASAGLLILNWIRAN